MINNIGDSIIKQYYKLKLPQYFYSDMVIKHSNLHNNRTIFLQSLHILLYWTFPFYFHFLNVEENKSVLCVFDAAERFEKISGIEFVMARGFRRDLLELRMPWKIDGSWNFSRKDFVFLKLHQRFDKKMHYLQNYYILNWNGRVFVSIFEDDLWNVYSGGHCLNAEEK